MNADVSPMMVDLAQEPAFRLGALTVKPETLEVSGAGRRDVLEPRVMQVLVVLARRRGHMVSRDELIHTCWGGRVVGDDAITRCLVRLRKLAHASGAFDVETVPRVGVRLIEHDEPKVRRRLGARWALAAVGLLAVLGGAVAARWTLQPSLAVPEGIRVAVAEPRVLAGDAAALAYATGLAGDIEGQATRSGARIVASGRADFTLAASVEPQGQQMRVSLQLLDARSRAPVWSTSMAGAPEDLRRQATVAAAAAVQCAGRARAPGAGRVGDVALMQYLRACILADDPEAATEVYTLLEEVTLRAPEFAPGHAGLAAFAAIGSKNVDEPMKSRLKARGAEQARVALRLNPADGLAYMAQEMLVEPRRDWRKRQALLDRGLEGDPRNFALVTRQGIVLAAQGRLSEAEVFHRRAVTLNPFAANSAAELAITLDARGSLDQARAAIDNAARDWPANPQVQAVRFEIEALHGDPLRATAMLADPTFGGQIAGPRERELLQVAIAALASGAPDEIARARQAVRAAHETELWPPLAVQILSALGDVDGAIGAAEVSVRRYGAYEPVYLFRASTRALRQDPRFMRVAAAWGLTDYWSQTDTWPDFCSDPTLPYDCRSEAAKYAAAR